MSADSSGDSPRRSFNGSRSPSASGGSPRSSRAGSASPARPPAASSPGREYATEPPSDTPTRVFVHGLTDKVVERHIDEIFGFYGHIERLRMTPPHYRTHRRSAMIEYASPEDARLAIAHMNRGQIDGVRVAVTFTEERESDEPRPRHDKEQSRPAPRRWGPASPPRENGWERRRSPSFERREADR